MIIPLRHESNHGRRWPVVTIAIITLNSLIFLATHGALEEQFRRLAEVQSRTIRLAATHPEAPLSQSQQDLVSHFRRSQPATWDRVASEENTPQDMWDLQMRQANADRINQELIELGQQLDQAQQSAVARYAFIPSRPTLVGYITANFLHGGWLHLIFNMWFLWLAGAVLEDVWGRALYGAFYMVSGI